MVLHEYKSADILWYFNWLSAIRPDKSEPQLNQILIEVERNKFLLLMLEQSFGEYKHIRVLHDKQLCQLKKHVACRQEVHCESTEYAKPRLVSIWPLVKNCDRVAEDVEILHPSSYFFQTLHIRLTRPLSLFYFYI